MNKFGRDIAKDLQLDVYNGTDEIWDFNDTNYKCIRKVKILKRDSWVQLTDGYVDHGWLIQDIDSGEKILLQPKYLKQLTGTGDKIINNIDEL